ncbi:MAG: hypothetical protein ACXADY_10565 [Candidatus Hodarchaeales archaeon]
MSKDQQVTQFMDLVKEKAKYASDPILLPSSRLKKRFKKYQKNKDDKYGVGLYYGLLFEYYVTSFLIQAANELQSVRWFVPARVKGKYLKPRQRRNRLTYNRHGEIILYYGSVPAAEFDGILRIRKKTIIVEIKCNVYGGIKTVQKLMSRLDMFKAAYKRDTYLLLILPAESTLFKGQKILAYHPKIHILELPLFQEFKSKFENKQLSVKKMMWKQFSSKLKPPHDVFPQKIRFKQYQSQFLKSFNHFLMKKSSCKEFFEKNKENIDLIGKIPIGKIAPDCDIKSFDSPIQRIKQNLSSGVDCVLFMKFREPFVVPEVISCINEMGKGLLPQYRRMTFLPEHNSFSKGRLKVTKGTLAFKLANQVRFAENVRILNTDDIVKLISAGNQMTDYWTQHSYLREIQKGLEGENH